MQYAASSGYLRIKRDKSADFSGAKGEHFISVLDQIDAEDALVFKLRDYKSKHEKTAKITPRILSGEGNKREFFRTP